MGLLYKCSKMERKEDIKMNTYGKPTHELNMMFKHFNDLRHETNHVYEIIRNEDLPIRKFYEESRTITEFKMKCKKHLGW